MRAIDKLPLCDCTQLSFHHSMRVSFSARLWEVWVVFFFFSFQSVRFRKCFHRLTESSSSKKKKRPNSEYLLEVTSPARLFFWPPSMKQQRRRMDTCCLVSHLETSPKLPATGSLNRSLLTYQRLRAAFARHVLGDIEFQADVSAD